MHLEDDKMALSNWDTISWNEKGNNLSGKMTVGDITVEIYKNYAHIQHKKAWIKESHFVKPYVIQIHEGNLTYLNIDIYAKRGKQNSIYLVVESEKRKMFGIGCYGYKRNKFVGVTQDTLNDFIKWAKKQESDYNFTLVLPKNPKRFNQGDTFFIGTIKSQTKIGKQLKETLFTSIIKNKQKGDKIGNKRGKTISNK